MGLHIQINSIVKKHDIKEDYAMIIEHLSSAVRYTGRWVMEDTVAQTTTPGAMLEIAFTGNACVLLFDVNMNFDPYPHVYIQVDDGARVETRIDHYVRVEAPEGGNHVVKMIFKSAMENQPRWHKPLVGKISFKGAEAEAEGVLPRDNREIIEFIGDSITEGIWVDDARKPYSFGQYNMVYQNDATATYAYLTAQALGLRPYIMGYGAVGVTKGGSGGVPKVIEAYPYYFDKIPAKPSGAKIIVINHGANDHLAAAEDYVEEYARFLDLVRQRNPEAKIVALSAFGGYHHTELGEMITRYNQSRRAEVSFIDSTGWIPVRPTHPLRQGHETVARHLIPLLKKILED